MFVSKPRKVSLTLFCYLALVLALATVAQADSLNQPVARDHVQLNRMLRKRAFPDILGTNGAAGDPPKFDGSSSSAAASSTSAASSAAQSQASSASSASSTSASASQTSASVSAMVSKQVFLAVLNSPPELVCVRVLGCLLWKQLCCLFQRKFVFDILGSEHVVPADRYPRSADEHEQYPGTAHRHEQHRQLG